MPFPQTEAPSAAVSSDLSSLSSLPSLCSLTHASARVIGSVYAASPTPVEASTPLSPTGEASAQFEPLLAVSVVALVLLELLRRVAGGPFRLLQMRL